RFTFDCPGMMGQRYLYEQVEQVCDDCYNLYREEKIAVNCRENCFLNSWFTVCLQATMREHETPRFDIWRSILKA
uniref:Probable molt-inhibiting hormone n=1 Tax=Jasus lalandii TaxID=99572 RepID=MIH_JASLA|nr:RecName: Full=Probable molt-inhibiting hormone; Short=MIH [Jasus lalandii]